MIYKRPLVFSEPKGLTLIRSTDYEIVDPRTGIAFPKNIQIMENFLLVKQQDGSMVGKGKAGGRVPDEIIIKLIDFSDLIAKCCSIAETLNQNLLSFLLEYEGGNDELYSMDFMNLRARLSEIVKKDNRVSEIEKLSTARSRKTFRKLFAEFIEDRNIYTHGELIFRKNDNSILLKYIVKSQKKATFCIVDEDTLMNYFDLYKYLNEHLGLIRERIKKHTLEK